MDGLPGLRKNISLKALFVLLAVLAFLFLGAVFSQPARADLIGADSELIDQVEEVAEATGATVADSGAPANEADDAAPLEEVIEEVVPPVAEDAIEIEVVPPVVEEVIEVADAPPVLEDLAAVVEDVPPLVEESIELVDDGVRVVEDALPIVDDVPIVEELLPILDEVVSFAPPLVVDVIQVLPILVFDVVGIPGPIDVPTAPAIPPTLNPSPASLATEIAKAPTPRSDGLSSRQLVAELAQLQLAGLMDASSGGPLSSSPVPDQETASLAAYVPIAGPLPVVETGAGGSGLGSSSHSGGGFFGGLGAVGYFAALAALLALCLVGWIRDRSRSGQSIFPSHGGRPG